MAAILWVKIYFFQIMLWLIYGINCPNIVLFGPQKIKSLGLTSHFPFCLKFDFSLFPMLISPLKQGWNEKIRTLIQSNLAIREKLVVAFFSLIARFLLLAGFHWNLIKSSCRYAQVMALRVIYYNNKKNITYDLNMYHEEDSYES